MMQPTMSQLQVNKIESKTGFTIVQEGQTFIPKTYNYSLHIIDLKQLDELMTELTTSISLFPEPITQTLQDELSKLQDKLSTLQNEHHTINKRGLFNFLGTINKWMTGTMDDNDRQIINKHLESIDINNII